MTETKSFVYLIRKEAIYNHQILGVFTTEEKAKAAFNTFYEQVKSIEDKGFYNDFDGHHTYNLYKIPLDECFSLIADGHFCESYEEDEFQNLSYSIIGRD
tara:strand:- start:253 stop:552 length:300 start_codon:yes stop_codon:yes gene_type:complete